MCLRVVWCVPLLREGFNDSSCGGGHGVGPQGDGAWAALAVPWTTGGGRRVAAPRPPAAGAFSMPLRPVLLRAVEAVGLATRF